MTGTEKVWAPEACTLPTVEQPLRVAEFDELFATALREQRRVSESTVQWWFDPGAEALARDLTAREAACCTFFSFSFSGDREDLVVEVRVPPEHARVLAALASRAAAGLATP